MPFILSAALTISVLLSSIQLASPPLIPLRFASAIFLAKKIASIPIFLYSGNTPSAITRTQLVFFLPKSNLNKPNGNSLPLLFLISISLMSGRVNPKPIILPSFSAAKVKSSSTNIFRSLRRNLNSASVKGTKPQLSSHAEL